MNQNEEERQAIKQFVDPTSIPRSDPIGFAKYLINVGWGDEDIVQSMISNFAFAPLTKSGAKYNLAWAHDQIENPLVGGFPSRPLEIKGYNK